MIIPGTFLFDLGPAMIFVYGSSILIGLAALGETNFADFFFEVDFLYFFGLPLAPPFSSPDVSSLVKYDLRNVDFNSTLFSSSSIFSNGLTLSSSFSVYMSFFSIFSVSSLDFVGLLSISVSPKVVNYCAYGAK
jgi:hypothetical protein